MEFVSAQWIGWTPGLFDMVLKSPNLGFLGFFYKIKNLMSDL